MTSPADRADETPLRLAELLDLGFDEIMIDVPWVHGMERATEVALAAKAVLAS